MRNVPGGIVITDALHRRVEGRIERKSAYRRVPFEPGMGSMIGDMTFSNHETKMPRAVGPQDRVKEDRLALAIGDRIGANLPRRFPLQRILVGDRAQSREPMIDF